MNSDFHYYVAFLAARIAYFTQHTVMEARWSPEEMIQIQKIWVPFHFIPSNLNEKFFCLGKTLSEAWKKSIRFLCLHDSETSATMMEQARKDYRKTGNLPGDSERPLHVRPRGFLGTYRPYGKVLASSMILAPWVCGPTRIRS